MSVFKINFAVELRHGRVLKRTVCQALGAIPVFGTKNWILRQLRVAFSQELKRRASLVAKNKELIKTLYIAYLCQRKVSDCC